MALASAQARKDVERQMKWGKGTQRVREGERDEARSE